MKKKKEILLQIPVPSKYFKTLINHSRNQSISRLRSIIRKTWAYQNSNKSFARHWHVRTPINHWQDLDISRHDKSFARFLGISRLTDQSFEGLGHIKTPKFSASLWHIRTLINHSQDLGISIKPGSISQKTWVCHRLLVRYIIHL